MFTMEIARLIERCRQGDADALGELYKAYAQRMRGVCRRYVSDEHHHLYFIRQAEGCLEGGRMDDVDNEECSIEI